MANLADVVHMKSYPRQFHREDRRVIAMYASESVWAIGQTPFNRNLKILNIFYHGTSGPLDHLVLADMALQFRPSTTYTHAIFGVSKSACPWTWCAAQVTRSKALKNRDEKQVSSEID